MEYTYAILAFTVFGFMLGCFGTGRTIWKESQIVEPRKLTDLDTYTIVDQLKTGVKSDVTQLVKELVELDVKGVVKGEVQIIIDKQIKGQVKSLFNEFARKSMSEKADLLGDDYNLTDLY